MSCQFFSSFGITFRLFSCQVIPTVYFDNQLFGQTNEIRYIIHDYMLLPEMRTHPATFQIMPKDSLCFCRIVSVPKCKLLQ